MDLLTATLQANIQRFFKNGMPVATWHYSSDGNIKREGEKISGVVRMYGESGSLLSEMTYKHNDPNGRFSLFSENGFLKKGNLKTTSFTALTRSIILPKNKTSGYIQKGIKNGNFRLL